MITSAAPPKSPNSSRAAEIAADYLTTEAHYLYVGGRIASALNERVKFVLVTSDPPPDPHLFSHALRKATEGRFTVVPVSCGSELTINGMPRAASAVVTLPAGPGIKTVPETPESVPPLFVANELDGNPTPHIQRIREAAQDGLPQGTAGVLLARTGFLSRLAEPSLQFLKGAPVIQFRCDEIGEDEGIEFLRHQLSVRHCRKEASGVRSGALRGVAALGGMFATGIGGFVLLQHMDLFGELADGSIIRSPMLEAGAPLSTAREMTSATPEKVATADASAPATSSAPPLDTKQQPARVPPTFPTDATPAQNPAPEEATSPTLLPGTGNSPADAAPSSPPLAPPTQTAVSQYPSLADIAALVTRGNDFLSVGDIASARLFYERAANAGDGAAALRLGATFDPKFLVRAGIRGALGDSEQAASWYRRARDLGNAAAAERLKSQPPDRRGPPPQ
jgi:hypothetical protein